MIKYFKQFSDWVNGLEFRNHYKQNTFDQKIDSLISNHNCKTILEIGGNNRPIINKKKYPTIHLAGVDPDIQLDEGCLTQNGVYDDFSLCEFKNYETEEKYDLILMDMVFEHIENNTTTLNKISSMLKNGGYFITHNPSNLHPYALINQALPQGLKIRILKLFRPWSQVGVITGWPSHYHLCNYLTLRAEAKKKKLEAIDGICSYNASDYFAFFPPLFFLIVIYEEIIKFFKLELLCSDYWVLFKKRDN